MYKELIDFVANSVRAEEKNKQEWDKWRQSADLSIPRPLGEFWAARTAGDLVAPCRKKASHHREREQFYTKALEEAEVELREKGLSIEVYDPSTGTMLSHNLGSLPPDAIASGNINIGHLASGAITLSSSFGNYSNAPITPSNMPKFQPKVDQDMLNRVERAKTKMLDHRGKAERYEKLARAFAVNPDFTVKLSVDDVTYFGLEDE